MSGGSYAVRGERSKAAIFCVVLLRGLRFLDGGMMADGSSSGVRLVRCPRCGNLSPELSDYSTYRCGACGAFLRGNFVSSFWAISVSVSSLQRNLVYLLLLCLEMKVVNV